MTKQFVVLNTTFVQRFEVLPDGKLGNPELLRAFSYTAKTAKTKSRSIENTEGEQEYLA